MRTSRIATYLLGLALALLQPSAVLAQTGTAKSNSVLASEINSLWSDNTVGTITPFNARQTLLDIVSSGLSGATISGTPSTGYVLIATSPTAAAWGNNFAGPFTATSSGLSGVSGFSGPAGLSMIGSMGGNSSSNNYSPVVVSLTDTVASTGYVYPAIFFDTLNSTSVSGGRPGLTGQVTLQSATSPTNPHRFYAGVSGEFAAGAADNGTMGAVQGYGYGVSGNCTMTATAIHWGGCIGVDSAVFLLTGATDIQRREGFVAEGSGNVQGSSIDVAYDVFAPSQPWNIGILFDDSTGNNPVGGGAYPISVGGTLIKAAFSSTVNISLRAGLDLSQITGAWTGDAIMLPSAGGISWWSSGALQWQWAMSGTSLELFKGVTAEVVIDSSGNLHVNGGYYTNGIQGITQTCTVNQAKTLIFTNGILTGGTCNS
jgi:hypothetical protein